MGNAVVGFSNGFDARPDLAAFGNEVVIRIDHQQSGDRLVVCGRVHGVSPQISNLLRCGVLSVSEVRRSRPPQLLTISKTGTAKNRRAASWRRCVERENIVAIFSWLMAGEARTM